MKKIIFVLASFSVSMACLAQIQYEVSNDGKNKILKGIISKETISNDTSFQWFAQNQASYKADERVVNAIKTKGSGIRFIVFGGTWCGDTKDILPKFFSLLDAAAFPPEKVSLLGVDRNKKTIGYLSEALGITNVPTILVMKDGKEIGRVVEYGKTGNWDKELGAIIDATK